jgi:4'-phosphopantetheinyl transferase
MWRDELETKAIRPGEILAWLMEVDEPPATTVKEWRTCLDAAELTRADSFYSDLDRITYIGAHWLLRNALAETGGLPPSHWRFVKGKHGKPQIDAALTRPDLCFNLSHSKGLVACVVATGAPIGIDVELISSAHSGLGIASRYFSADEIALLRSRPLHEQPQTFFRLWTLKEALIKATGEGLHRSLDSFSFSLDPTAVIFHPRDGERADAWVFFEHRPTARHALAVAIKYLSAQPARLSIFRIHP